MYLEVAEKDITIKVPRAWLPFLYTTFISSAMDYIETIEEADRDPENVTALELMRDVALGFGRLSQEME